MTNFINTPLDGIQSPIVRGWMKVLWISLTAKGWSHDKTG